MLSKLILYWLTHGYAIICSVAIAVGDYLAQPGRALEGMWAMADKAHGYGGKGSCADKKSNEARWLITAIGPCAMREETLQRLAELHPLTVRPGDHQITHAVGTAGLQRRPFNHRIPQLRQPTLRGRQIDDPQSDMVDTIGVGGASQPFVG